MMDLPWGKARAYARVAIAALLGPSVAYKIDRGGCLDWCSETEHKTRDFAYASRFVRENSLFWSRKPDDAGHIVTAIFVELESNLSREFVSQWRELVLNDPVVPSREACHADPNRARPLFPCAPIACNVFAYGQHVVGRAGVLAFVLSAR